MREIIVHQCNRFLRRHEAEGNPLMFFPVLFCEFILVLLD